MREYDILDIGDKPTDKAFKFGFLGGRDPDKDGVPDPRDMCPKHPEDSDGDRDKDGCPDQPDPNLVRELLIDSISLMVDIPNGIRTSLLAKAGSAESALRRGNQEAARGALEAFINELDAIANGLGKDVLELRLKNSNQAAHFLRVRADNLKPPPPPQGGPPQVRR